MIEPLMRLASVSKAFGSHSVLRDISFEIRRGETVAIIGESGCGKTVLLKNMVGLATPDSGRVLIEERSIFGGTAQETAAIRSRIGFLFQGAALFDSITVFENVAFPLRSRKRFSEPEIGRIVRNRLTEVGLTEDAFEKLPTKLSGGMRKRVGLARALALDPDIMFYDEPTTGLDPIMTDLIDALILQTRQRRPITSIIVTHEMKTVRRVADRAIMLYPISRLEAERSQIIFDGSTVDLFSSCDDRVMNFVR